MLRHAWANEKKSTCEEEVQSQQGKTLRLEQESNMEMIDVEYNDKYDSNRFDFDYYLQNWYFYTKLIIYSFQIISDLP